MYLGIIIIWDGHFKLNIQIISLINFIKILYILRQEILKW